MTAASTPMDSRAEHRDRGQDGPYGRILVVTPEPIPMEANPTLLTRVRDGISRRPWIFPAVLVGTAAAYLLLRRR